MTRHRIEQLAKLLPADAEFFTAGRPPDAAPPGLAERIAMAVNAPDFARRFLTHFVVRGTPLPPTAHESWLRRAHSHFAGANVIPDPIMIQVEQLTLAVNEFTRHVLNGLLVSKDISFAQIAEHLGLDVQAVIAYEQLHFNYRDRTSDKAYAARLIYPEGRFQSLKTDGFEAMTVEARLLIAGYTHGAKEVLWLAGLNHDENPPSTEQSLKNFEDALVTNAMQLARAGALNGTTAPGIAHVKSLLVAKRNSEQLKDLPRIGQPDISLGNAILLSMPRTKEGAERATAAANARAKGHAEFFAKLGGG